MKNWSEQEVGFLRNNYIEMTDIEIAKSLERTLSAIRSMRSRLSLKKYVNKGQFKMKPMPSKIELEELYLEKNMTPFRIGLRYSVSHNTVKNWFQKYNIPIKRPYTSYVKLNITETDKSYFAGYLDGDGTISASFSNNLKSRKGYGLHIEVSLVSINKEYICILKEIIGGKINSFIYEDSRSKKECYKLCFSNQASALSFLKAIEPYLILKKKQAIEMIKFLESRIDARKKKGNSAIISEEAWGYFNEVRRLNRL